jgi:hypothetical protein
MADRDLGAVRQIELAEPATPSPLPEDGPDPWPFLRNPSQDHDDDADGRRAEAVGE